MKFLKRIPHKWYRMTILYFITFSSDLITTKGKRKLMHCGKALMLLRKFKNKTQQDIAEKLGTTQQYISELEKQNHISVEKLNSILKALTSNREEFEKFKKTLPLIINES